MSYYVLPGFGVGPMGPPVNLSGGHGSLGYVHLDMSSFRMGRRENPPSFAGLEWFGTSWNVLEPFLSQFSGFGLMI